MNATVSSKVIARLKPQIGKLQGVKFFMQAGQDVTVGGRLEQAQYQYTLTDNDAVSSSTTGRQYCCAAARHLRS